MENNISFLCSNLIQYLVYNFLAFYIIFSIIKGEIYKRNYIVHFISFLLFCGVQALFKIFIYSNLKFLSISPSVFLGGSFLILQTYFVDKIKYEILSKNDNFKKQKTLKNLLYTSRLFLVFICFLTVFSVPFYTNSWNYLRLLDFNSIIILTIMVPNVVIFGFQLKDNFIMLYLLIYIIMEFINNCLLIFYINFNLFYNFNKELFLICYLIFEFIKLLSIIGLFKRNLYNDRIVMPICTVNS